jgi:hypothetical protein
MAKCSAPDCPLRDHLPDDAALLRIGGDIRDASTAPSPVNRLLIDADDSLDAEDTERLKRAKQYAREVLAHVEQAPTSGPLKRDLNDSEAMLAWAVDYLSDVIEGMKGTRLARSHEVTTAFPRKSDKLLGRMIQMWFGKEQSGDPVPTRETHEVEFFDRMGRVYDVMLRAYEGSAPSATVHMSHRERLERARGDIERYRAELCEQGRCSAEITADRAKAEIDILIRTTDGIQNKERT